MGFPFDDDDDDIIHGNIIIMTANQAEAGWKMYMAR